MPDVLQVASAAVPGAFRMYEFHRDEAVTLAPDLGFPAEGVEDTSGSQDDEASDHLTLHPSYMAGAVLALDFHGARWRRSQR